MYTIDDIKLLQTEALKYRSDDPGQVISICNQIAAMSKDAGYEYGTVFASYYSCEARYNLDRIDESITELSKLASSFHERGFYEFEIRSYNLLGLYLDSKGDVFSSLEAYVSAADVAREYGFPLHHLMVTNNIGCIFTRLGEYESAISYFKDAFDVLETLEDSDTVEYMYNLLNINIALDHLLLGNIEKSEQYISKLITKKKMDPLLLMCSYIVRSAVLSSHGETERARKLAKEAVSYFIRTHTVVHTLDIFYSCCDQLLTLKEYKLFEEYIDACIDYASARDLTYIERSFFETKIAYLQDHGTDEQLDFAYSRYYELCRCLSPMDGDVTRKSLQLKLSLMEASQKHQSAVEYNKELQMISQTDALTYLPNRYKYDSAVPYYFSRSQDEKKNFCYVLMDVDSFKQYNDTYGHLLGDSCLWHIASVLRTEMANDVMFFRYGGDEFAGLYFDKTDAFIEDSLNRITKAIADLKLEHKTSKREKYVTVTYGYVNECPKNTDKVLDFVNKADMRLYKNKAAWKNILVGNNKDSSGTITK